MNVKIISILVLLSTIWTITSVRADITTNLSPNPGFDFSSVPYGSSQYEHHADFWAANWILDDGAGIVNHNSTWGGEAAVNTVAVIQNFRTNAGAEINRPSISQIITSNATHFNISFDLARRVGYDIGMIDVYWDNELIVDNLIPAATTFINYNYTDVKGLPFKQHTLTFRGVATAPVEETLDASIFIDNVTIQAIYP